MYIAYFLGESSFAETCSFTESQKWEQLSNGATPSSSVDLEWENEIGNKIIYIYRKKVYLF